MCRGSRLSFHSLPPAASEISLSSSLSTADWVLIGTSLLLEWEERGSSDSAVSCSICRLSASFLQLCSESKNWSLFCQIKIFLSLQLGISEVWSTSLGWNCSESLSRCLLSRLDPPLPRGHLLSARRRKKRIDGIQGF